MAKKNIEAAQANELSVQRVYGKGPGADLATPRSYLRRSLLRIGGLLCNVRSAAKIQNTNPRSTIKYSHVSREGIISYDAMIIHQQLPEGRYRIFVIPADVLRALHGPAIYLPIRQHSHYKSAQREKGWLEYQDYWDFFKQSHPTQSA